MSQTVESAELPTCAVCCQRVVWALRPSERPLLQGKMLNAIQELQPEACTAVRGGALTINNRLGKQQNNRATGERAGQGSELPCGQGVEQKAKACERGSVSGSEKSRPGAFVSCVWVIIQDKSGAGEWTSS
jgi:hypothetical protein